MPNRETATTDTAREPSPAQIREQLARMLGSAAFAQAGRATEFLRFVVEETLAGRAERLKGYTIGVAVFDRPPDFDAQADPLVRVEASRLRRRLIEYYHAEGRDDPVRIVLPKGGYAPTFAAARMDAAAPPVAAPGTRPPRRGRMLAGLVGAGVLAAAALGSWVAWQRSSTLGTTVPDTAAVAAAARTGPVSPSGPRLLVLPLANLSGDQALDAVADGTTEEIIRALVSFSIFATASPAGRTLESTELAALRREFGAGYVLTGSIRSANDELRVAVRLIDTELGTQLWTRSFDEHFDRAAVVALQENIGSTLARILSSPFGPVYGHEIARTAAKPAAELDPYECLLRFYEYVRFFDGAGHADSLRCLQRAVQSEPRFAPAWSALAVVYLHEHLFGYSKQPDRRPPLERALEAVRTSLDIDGSGRVAAVTLAGIRLADGDREQFRQAVDRALAITPAHPAASMLTGYLLIQAGDWQRGAALLDESVPQTVNVPAWAYVAYAFRYLQTHEYAQALDWSLRSDAPSWFVAAMTVTASAALAGRADIAQREKARLLALYPGFEATGRAQLAKWNLDAGLLETLLEGLRLAGLDIA